MEIDEYAEKAERTCVELELGLHTLHMILGIVTESGELTDAIKKSVAYGKDLDEVNIKEEVGDLMWYVVNLCRANKWKLQDILDINIEKLKVRYPDKFTKEYALKRNLEKERKILESLGFRES